jgi:carbonic anhydrase/acetyltransferase-like protein (isoleucine patch superfamily)
MSKILPYNGVMPIIAHDVFIAQGSFVIGKVEIGSGSSIWFNSVIRGDVADIKIGKNTNIQDGSVIHVSRGGGDTIIGDNVTVGHMALLHACRLMDNCFIGMGAIVMDNAIVEENSYVGAGSMVTNGKIVKEGELWLGRPAKFVRKLTKDEIVYIKTSSNNYVELAKQYLYP